MQKINQPQKMLFISALSAIFIGIIWVSIITPLATKLPPNYQQGTSYFGTLKEYDSLGENIVSSTIIERSVSDNNEGVYKNFLYIKRTDSISDYINHNVLVQGEDKFMASRTNRSFSNVRDGMYFLFPQNTEKKDYNDIVFPIYPELYTNTLKYSHEESLFGLSVLVFRYKEVGIDFHEDDTSKKANFFGKIWVEPRTGSVIRHENSWDVYVINNSNEETIIKSGATWQQDEETRKLVRTTQSKKAVSQIYEMWIPLYLLIFAIASGTGAFLKSSIS